MWKPANKEEGLCRRFRLVSNVISEYESQGGSRGDHVLIGEDSEEWESGNPALKEKLARILADMHDDCFEYNPPRTLTLKNGQYTEVPIYPKPLVKEGISELEASE
jgi:hypothetical protein